MKKFAIACAVVMATALSLTSCGDTQYCYEVKITTTVLGIENTTTTYMWATSNELDTYIASQKAALEKTGISEDAIKTSYSKTSKSKDDCHK